VKDTRTVPVTVKVTQGRCEIVRSTEVAHGATLSLDAGNALQWSGATPLRCHGNRGGRSSPQECSEALAGEGGSYAISHPEELRASREVRILRLRDLQQMRNRARCGSIHAERRVVGLV